MFATGNLTLLRRGCNRYLSIELVRRRAYSLLGQGYRRPNRFFQQWALAHYRARRRVGCCESFFAHAGPTPDYVSVRYLGLASFAFFSHGLARFISHTAPATFFFEQSTDSSLRLHLHRSQCHPQRPVRSALLRPHFSHSPWRFAFRSCPIASAPTNSSYSAAAPPHSP